MLLFSGGNPPAQMMPLGLFRAPERKLAMSAPEGSPNLRGWLRSHSAPLAKEMFEARKASMYMALKFHMMETESAT